MAVVIGVVAVLAIAGFLGYKFILGGSNSDEDAIRAVMQQEQAAFNNLDYNAYLQTLCAEQRPQQESQLRWVSQNKAANDRY
jgi:hypothetical protein